MLLMLLSYADVWDGEGKIFIKLFLGVFEKYVAMNLNVLQIISSSFILPDTYDAMI